MIITVIRDLGTKLFYLCILSGNPGSKKISLPFISSGGVRYHLCTGVIVDNSEAPVLLNQ